MVETVRTLPALRAALAGFKRENRRVALVPTMGNLHDGHLGLVKMARRHADVCITSIFVNPTQFGPGEDFDSYPRTLEADVEALAGVGCDLVWQPAIKTMYPLGESFMVRVPQNLAGQLCGRSRPGHFDGVASVVLRLFSQVQPDVAVFGEKDFQQLLIIRRMVQDLSLPVEIAGAPIARTPDGLAMSSRNAYLTDAERRAAPRLYAELSSTAQALAAGGDFELLKEAAWARLAAAGFRPDYLEWRNARDLGEPADNLPARLFVAAWLGRARLIDNVPVAVFEVSGVPG